MNYHLNFLIITCLATRSSTGMELQVTKKETPNIVTTITCLKKPSDGLYLTENNILINQRHHCSIINTTTNQELRKINSEDSYIQSIGVHPDRIKFALSDYSVKDGQQKIRIYDSQTYAIEHTINWNDHTYIKSIAFNKLDEIAVTKQRSPEVTLCNYKTNKTTYINIPGAVTEHKRICDPHIALHPTQPISYVTWRNVYIHNFETSKTQKIDSILTWHYVCQYSTDGNYVVRGSYDKIVVDTENDNIHSQVMPREPHNNVFCNIAIHPNSKVFITLLESSRDSHKNYTLKYHTINDLGCITAMDLPFYTTSSDQTVLSFSPSGKKLFVNIGDTCAELEVPFEVIYQNDTKEKFPFILFLLKNYSSHWDDIEIPQDVNNFISKILLEVHKR